MQAGCCLEMPIGVFAYQLVSCSHNTLHAMSVMMMRLFWCALYLGNNCNWLHDLARVITLVTSHFKSNHQLQVSAICSPNQSVQVLIGIY